MNQLLYLHGVRGAVEDLMSVEEVHHSHRLHILFDLTDSATEDDLTDALIACSSIQLPFLPVHYRRGYCLMSGTFSNHSDCVCAVCLCFCVLICFHI